MEAKFSTLLIATVLLTSVGTVQAGDQDVTAKNPLVETLFTIDRNSPEVIDGVVGSADLLRVGADPNDPEVAIPAENMSLYHPWDDLDAVATRIWQGCTTTKFTVLFSVDRMSEGGVPPDPNMEAQGFPFNVLDQAFNGQAAGDAFMTLVLYTRMGYIPPIRGSISNNNTLVVNHGDAGGVDFKLSPKDASPLEDTSGDGQSNVNGAGATQPSGSSRMREVPSTILFSLSEGSPSLLTLPGTGSPADIFVDRNTMVEGGEQLYLAPYDIGLLLDDDIDAMIVVDYDDEFSFDAGVDQIIFSLAPGSPTLNGEFGPGDLFTSSGNNYFTLFCPGGVFGLAPTDNLNMLDYAYCENANECVRDWAIGFQCVGDLDRDGDVDLADLAELLSVYGLCAGDQGYNPDADLNDNGCIDLSDLATLLGNYGDVCW